MRPQGLEVHVTAQAKADLLDLWEYIARDSVSAADQVIDSITARLLQLAQYPLSGRTRDELTPGLHSSPVGRFIVFYFPEGDRLSVIRVVRGERDLATLFKG